MKEKHQNIEVENLGPIQDFSFKLASPGVTTITAPNGFGKSILIESLANVAAGNGGLPLRHGTEKGRIDGLGVHVSINPKQTRTAGEFAVDHLEGKLNLASLVEPGVKDEIAADKRRIKALISLTGVEADVDLFLKRPEFTEDEFEATVSSEARKATDLVEMATRIARDYQAAARGYEGGAERDQVAADNLRAQLAEVDMTKEHDADKLNDALYDWQRKYAVGSQAVLTAQEKAKAADDARRELKNWDERGVPLDAKEAKKAVKAAEEKHENLIKHSDSLVVQLRQLEQSIELCDREIQTAAAEYRSACDHSNAVEDHVKRREACLKAIADAENFKAPSPEELEEINASYRAAKQAMEDGVRVRDARMKQASVKAFEDSAASRRENAERLRKIATATDNVLSDAIESKWVKIVTEPGGKRVYGYVESKDLWAPYHELSATEKWAIAIEIGVERVGEGGLLFIPQEAWEGVDVWNRKFIHEHAKQRGVFILTAEATRDESLGRELAAQTND